MLSSDFLFPSFFVVPLANPSNFSHCKCFSSRSGVGRGWQSGQMPPLFLDLYYSAQVSQGRSQTFDIGVSFEKPAAR